MGSKYGDLIIICPKPYSIYLTGTRRAQSLSLGFQSERFRVQPKTNQQVRNDIVRTSGDAVDLRGAAIDHVASSAKSVFCCPENPKL